MLPVQLDLLSANIKLNLDIKIFWISVIYLFKARYHLISYVCFNIMKIVILMYVSINRDTNGDVLFISDSDILAPFSFNLYWQITQTKSKNRVHRASVIYGNKTHTYKVQKFWIPGNNFDFLDASPTLIYGNRCCSNSLKRNNKCLSQPIN